jgi:thioredoxin-like negative regulator of GroEL
MVEKEVMNICAREPRCVAHFYHPDFKRCEIMDKHLATLAQKYVSTRFIRVFVENVPWLVHKLSIQVLPCVICFVDGATKDRLIGFEELGNSDAFQTAVLELKLNNLGVIHKEVEKSELVYKIAHHTNKQRSDDDDVFDLDE